jgi:hypothetical protein
MIHRTILMGVLVCFCTLARAEAPHLLGSDGAMLERVREKYRAHDPQITAEVKAALIRADKALPNGPYTIVHKKHPLPGVDPHDYVSLATYFWPNPDTKDGLPYIRKDGQRTPETAEYDAEPLGNFVRDVKSLAIADYFSGEEKYADRAALLLRAWYFEPETKMNPNLDHAQLIKGVNLGRGTGIIDSLRLIETIDAAAMLEGSKSWTKEDDKKLKAWFTDYLHWLLTSKNGKDEAAAKNNHGSWYDVQVTAFAIYSGDLATAKRVTSEAGMKRVAVQVEKDGSQPLEMARTRSLHYSIFNTQALTELADLAARVDVPLWSFSTPDGRSIKLTIDWLIPYASGEAKWEKQQITAVGEREMLVPLRRAAAALHDDKYALAADAMAKKEGAADGTTLLFPGK